MQRWEYKIGECIWYGCPRSGREICEDLIVDDGYLSRGHRKGVFDPAFLSLGVSVKKHATFGYCAVLCFAHQAV